MIQIVYYLATGEITKYMLGQPGSEELNLESGESYSLVTYPIHDVSLVYMLNDEVTYRPVMDLAYSELVMTTEDTMTVSGIPAGALVSYPGGEAVINDGSIDWQSAVAGTFPFTISLFPYLTERFNVDVTEV